MDFTQLNGQEVLDRVSRHCPKALSTYIQCLNRSDSEGHIRFTRKQIEEEMSESWTVFRNHLKMLAREDLLSWSYNEKTDVITVVRPMIEEEFDDEEEEPAYD